MRIAEGYLCYILFISGTFSLAQGAATHDDLKDGLINLMHIVRSNTEKLERHESRERQLGDLLKKGLALLDKRGKAQDAMLENILKSQQNIAERLGEVQRAISVQEDAERGSYMIDAAPGQSMIKQIEAMIEQKNGGNRVGEIESKINPKIEYLTSVVEKLQGNLYSLNERIETLAINNGGPLKDELLTKVSSNHNLISLMARQVQDLRDSQLGNGVGGVNSNLLSELSGVTSKLENKLNEFSYSENVQADSVRLILNSIENKLIDLKNEFDDLNKEAKAIGNVEQVLVKTADDVMDTKRRVEHGIYQIRTEVNDYVKSSHGGSDYNDTAINKFTGLAETLLENQAGAVANLSSKVESEIAQVWRQIGIMHTQITTSGITLDNLQNQTNHFVKDTENKMDQMSSKLESIESSIDLVQENNNFLLGRFSLFTHEFNETRNSLAQTTNDLKKVLKQARIFSVDKSPGPHDIDSSPDNLVDNQV